MLAMVGISACYVVPASQPTTTAVIGRPAPPVEPLQSEPIYQGTCPPQTYEVARFATWCGKVNVHRDASGEWVADGDCRSGCNVDIGGYCRRLNSSTSHVVRVSPTPVHKPFVTARCEERYPSSGENEYVCCGSEG